MYVQFVKGKGSRVNNLRNATAASAGHSGMGAGRRKPEPAVRAYMLVIKTSRPRCGGL